MKKFFFMLIVSVLCCQLSAISQVKVGLAGGITIAKMEGRINGDGKGGLMTSLVLDAPIGRGFSFYPTVGYVQKGVTEPHPDGTLIEKQYVALRYAELSTNLVYHIGGEKDNSFFLGLGPSIDFNLPSKRTSVIDGTKTDADILFGETPENDLRGVDWGVNVVLGYRMKSFFITGNWNKGIRNLTPEGLAGETKNQYIGIQLGVFLKGKD